MSLSGGYCPARDARRMVASRRARASAAVRPGWRFQGPISPGHPCARNSVISQAPGPVHGVEGAVAETVRGEHGTADTAGATDVPQPVRGVLPAPLGQDLPCVAEMGRGAQVALPDPPPEMDPVGQHRPQSSGQWALVRRRRGQGPHRVVDQPVHGYGQQASPVGGARGYGSGCGGRRGPGGAVLPARDDLLPRLGVVQPGGLAVELIGGEDSGRHMRSSPYISVLCVRRMSVTRGDCSSGTWRSGAAPESRRPAPEFRCRAPGGCTGSRVRAARTGRGRRFSRTGDTHSPRNGRGPYGPSATGAHRCRS
ncbi:hypothetical protein SBADM41S_05031 [Streptomyces badius]